MMISKTIYIRHQGEKKVSVIQDDNKYIPQWFLWYIVQWFITPDSKMFWPMLAITWFCAYPILQLVETNGTALISKFIK